MNTVIINGVNITEENERLKITNDSLLVVNTNLAKELNELKRDISRFIVLLEKYNYDIQTTEEMHERWALVKKFQDVGKEE